MECGQLATGVCQARVTDSMPPGNIPPFLRDFFVITRAAKSIACGGGNTNRVSGEKIRVLACVNEEPQDRRVARLISKIMVNRQTTWRRDRMYRAGNSSTKSRS